MFKSQLKAAVSGIVILFIFLYGCTKIDTTTLGQDLIPAVDNIHTFDTTINVLVNNFDDASICDSVYRTDLHALGMISNDPLFGQTMANIYVELKPTSYPFKFPASDNGTLIIDSAVLVLHYNLTYGDTNAIQNVQVYPLVNKFTYDTTYTTCNVFPYNNANLLGEKSFVAKNLKDSLLDYKTMAGSQLRIPINKSLIQNFIQDSATIFKTDSTFSSYFKGLAIVPSASAPGQSLNYFDLSNADTRLAIYVRSSVGSTKDTTVISFPMTVYSGEANSIVHTRANAEMNQYLSHPAAGDSLVFIQTSPGSYATLTIPGLEKMSNRVIHRAEIIMDQVYSANTLDNLFTPPVNLYLDTKDTSTIGRYYPIPCDFTANEISTNFNNLGGQAKQVTDNAGNAISRYTFNISRYVQSIITRGSKSDVLRLSAPYYITNKTTYIDRCGEGIAPFTVQRNRVAAGRVKLNGSNATPNRMRLHIVYSNL